MTQQLVIPEAGESITEVRIGEWRRREGSPVALDEVLVEIETDKAAMELPAPVSGTLVKILKASGEEASPGDVIALIEPGEATRAQETAQTPAPHDAGEPALAGPSSTRDTHVMPAARRVLAQAGLPSSAAEPTGPGRRLLKEDAVRAVDAAGKGPRPPRADEASPDQEASAETAPEPVPPPPPAGSPAGAGFMRGEETIPMTPLRKAVARNLVRAQQDAALLTTFNEADMSEVISLRRTYGQRFRERHGIKLGFMSFFVKACVDALEVVPAVNSRVAGDKIVRPNYCDIGIAVGGGRGLVVPVLRNAESMSFAQVETSIADFAVRARKNKIEISELAGGTFTITNGGIYGSMLSTPIVNPPQSGILGMHAIQDRPVAVDGKVEVRPMMYLALTYDHRIIDGREAVTFLKRVRDLVERPERIWLKV